MMRVLECGVILLAYAASAVFLAGACALVGASVLVLLLGLL